MANRFYVAVFLQELVSSDSGDFGDEGEFYIKTNDSRFPCNGHVKLNENEVFRPPVTPTLYTAMMDGDDGPLKLKFKVMEHDTLNDDKMLEHKHNIPLEEIDSLIDISSDNGKVKMQVRVLVQSRPEW